MNFGSNSNCIVVKKLLIAVYYELKIGEYMVNNSILNCCLLVTDSSNFMPDVDITFHASAFITVEFIGSLNNCIFLWKLPSTGYILLIPIFLFVDLDGWKFKWR